MLPAAANRGAPGGPPASGIRSALKLRRRYYPEAVQQLLSGTSLSAGVLGVTALVCITILAGLGRVDSGVVVAIFSLVLGGAIGHAEGYTKGKQDAESSSSSS